MQCGFCELDITPQLGCTIPGYFHRRPAREIFDPLSVVAWVCSDNNNTAVIVSVDNIGIARPVVERIKDKIKTLLGIPRENILVNCSHAHSAGPFFSGSTIPSLDMAGPAPADVIEQDDWYLDFLSRRIVDAVLLAEKDRKPSELYFSKGALENFSFCRIYNMEGGGLQTNPFGMNTKTNVQEKHRKVIGPRKKIDTSVTVVEIRQDKKTRGVLVHFTCHCDVVGSETAISADYPGVLRRIIKERFCPETAVLFLQGPCGDINHVDTFHVAETKHAGRHLEIGRALADIALTCLKRGEASESSNIKAAGKDISVPLRKPGADLLAWSENIMKTVPEDARALADFDTKQVDRFFARTYIQWHNDSTKNREVFLQTLKIGDIGIYSSPGELFSEYGDGLMEKSSFKNTIVAAYSNDYAGYIVTPECYADGVYEARQTVFEPEAGSLMNDELLKLGKEINDGY